jgi:arylsulfatase A-like enzyme
MITVLLALLLPVMHAGQLPHIIQIVADDLGYNDLGYTNNNATLTPEINQLLSHGVRLTTHFASVRHHAPRP